MNITETYNIAELPNLRARHEREKLQLALLKQLQYINLAGHFVREYRFDPLRLWRLDLYAGEWLLGIELHGAVFTNGAHVRGQGFTDDREKMNAAVERGIRVLEYTTAQVMSGMAAAQIGRICGSGLWSGLPCAK